MHARQGIPGIERIALIVDHLRDAGAPKASQRLIAARCEISAVTLRDGSRMVTAQKIC